jgi:hypothetical protein
MRNENNRFNKKNKVTKSSTESIRILWEKGFYKDLKSYPDTVKQLGKLGYNFSSSELGMALKRAKYLTRRGKRGNYEYIQKYPFIEENCNKAK